MHKFFFWSLAFFLSCGSLLSQGNVTLDPDIKSMSTEFSGMVIDYIEHYVDLTEIQEDLIIEKIDGMSKEMSAEMNISSRSQVSKDPKDYIPYAKKFQSYLENEVLTEIQLQQITIPQLLPAIRYVMNQMK